MLEHHVPFETREVDDVIDAEATTTKFCELRKRVTGVVDNVESVFVI